MESRTYSTQIGNTITENKIEYRHNRTGNRIAIIGHNRK